MPDEAAATKSGYLATGWMYLKDSFDAWSKDNASRLAAALAFWTMLSIAPLLILCLKIVGMIFRKNPDAAQERVQGYLSGTVGSQNASTIQDMISSAGEQGSGVFATIVSIALLIWSASNVFVELQNSLNTLWEVKPDPNRGWLQTIKDRAFSMALVVSIAFLLLVSLVVSTVLSGLTKGFGGEQPGWLMEIVHSVVAIGVITVLFAMMFKYLPDVKIAWRDVWIGAIVTALLFTGGKFLLGWYLGRGSTTSVYGAAGSIVALLLWVYYSTLILFFGAEFTQVYAKAHNRGLQTARGAQPVTDDARAQEGLAPKRGAKTGVEYGQQKPAWQRYDPAGPGSRVVTIERPAPGTRKAFAIAGAGLATGAALAAAGWLSKKENAGQFLTLQQRLEAVRSRLGQIENLPRASRELSVAERVRAVNDRVQQLNAKHNGDYAPPAQMSGAPMDPVARPRAVASNLFHHFQTSFQRGRTQAAKPRTVAERLKAWITS